MTDQATRIILTQLPPTLTTPLLRAHLSKCPPSAPLLTDCKILLKPDGTSRRIAFAGFRSHAEADRVKAWADGSWVQGTGSGARIRVDWAKDAQDAPPPRKRVKLSPPPASVVPEGKQGKAVKDEAARFADFMAVMAPRKGRALEDFTSISVPTSAAAPVPTPAPIVEKKQKAKVIATVEPVPVADEHVEEAPKDAVVEDEGISDMEYMARRMKRRLEVDEDEEPDIEAAAEQDATVSGDTDDDAEKVWDQDEEDGKLPAEGSAEAVPETEEDELHSMLNASPRLFIRNLAFTIAEAELRELLEPFGALDQVHIPLDPATKKPKGMAYATFVDGASAISAFEALDRRSFQGRLLHLLPAVERDAKPIRADKTSGVKSAREVERKKEAGTGLSWGTLYMNADAVMSSVAERLKIDKAQLLDSSSDNTAVRVALAETHVIQETKKYFEEEGIDLESFGTRGARSQTTILVKNIPYNTSLATLTALFSPFGAVSRLLLPPAGTMAVVEMHESAAAAAAWRALVYKKLGASVLYLEKAPEGIWNSKAPVKKSVASLPPTTAVPPSAATPATTTPAATSSTAVDEPAEAGSTLFIKNLSFNTTSQGLTTAFVSLPEFLSARVQTKPDPKKPGQTLSMGFGFVVFRTAEGAKGGLRIRDGFVLDGHRLEVKFAQRGKEEERGGSGKEKKVRKEGKGTKLIVKNVPFEVTKKDIRELFSAYGQLRSVRLPRKLDRHTRGFAFLDFISHQEAVSAYNALEHTHLLGRHLVLQWAEEGADEVEALRKRTGFSDVKVGTNKKKFVIDKDGGVSAGGAAAGGEMEDDD